ncbi:hypothetical protein OESDEN_19167 [Oesophagostomum dentatum]|uniref:SXP/RAL-2 family protein Ani s 5-like cation-binding domain-containing protein n=1 Tax=Oesophagostomum dentatum TaxID=61180 RepID=A0A0B1SCB9_OESDE|nr:hypothetical protein OESDEN_19167 [Oesophagostomum dentatum]
MIKFILALGFVCIVCAEKRRDVVKPILRETLPAFVVMKASSQAKQEYHDIVAQRNNKISQEKKKLREWAKKHNLEKDYDLYEKITKQFKEARNKKVEAMLNELTWYNKKYVMIDNDENQTRKRRAEQLSEMQDNYPEQYGVLSVIRKLADALVRKGPPKDFESLLKAQKN